MPSLPPAGGPPPTRGGRAPGRFPVSPPPSPPAPGGLPGRPEPPSPEGGPPAPGRVRPPGRWSSEASAEPTPALAMAARAIDAKPARRSQSRRLSLRSPDLSGPSELSKRPPLSNILSSLWNRGAWHIVSALRFKPHSMAQRWRGCEDFMARASCFWGGLECRLSSRHHTAPLERTESFEARDLLSGTPCLPDSCPPAFFCCFWSEVCGLARKARRPFPKPSRASGI